MKDKEQIAYDISLDQYRHLKRQVSVQSQRVDVNELNKRLNIAKRSNLYTTVLISILCLSCLIILSFIGLKF